LKALVWRLHDPCRDLAWTAGHHLRRRCRRRTGGAVARRVLHVTGSFDLGGTQTQIRHLCTAPHARYEHRPVEIFPELNYVFRQGVAVDPTRYGGRGPLGTRLGSMVANINRRSSQLVQIYMLSCEFRRERPAIVVGWGHELCATTFVAAALARVPHIVFCIRTVNPTHYEAMSPRARRVMRRAHRSMAPLVGRIVVNSTLLRDDHARWAGVDPASIAICPNGIALELGPGAEASEARSRARAACGIPGDAIVVTNVGRFSPEKGQATLVEANRLLLTRGCTRPLVWLLCGDGPTLADVQQAAASYGMTNMLFLGRTMEVRQVLAASDIFVMPSDFEGMPNAMMEAMAAGLPCVSTNVSGALDVARDGVEALYYAPGDARQLARHLLALVTDPPRARAMGAAAAARIKEFSVDRFVRRFEAVLDTLDEHPQDRQYP
jgi:glycosyltransferase involved in cell wall biosynthesis